MEKETTLTLNGELTIHKATDIHKELVSVLNHHDYIKIVIDQPENLDLTFLQLLLATQKQAVEEGKQLEIIMHIASDLEDLLHKAGFQHLANE